MTADRAARAAALFRERFGRAAEGVFAAPGRVNLMGEHTDYNDGLVLPMAIRQCAVVAASRRSDGVVAGWSAQRRDGGATTIDTDDPPPARGWLAYAAGAVWALRDLVGHSGGFDLVVDSDVPIGAGLSSSAALSCAVALAVSEVTGAHIDRLSLARAARRAEVEVVGAPVGLMDQAASLLAVPDAALLLDCRSLHTRAVRLGLRDAGLQIVVLDTKVRHAHATGGYRDRRRECSEAAAALGLPALRDATPADVERLPDPLRRRARHVVTEDARVEEAVACLDGGDLAGIGPLLNRSHASLRDDFAVSIPELDTAVDAAMEAGALGARMTGGGFGGAALALVPDERTAAVAQAVEQAFAARGFAAPHVFGVEPSGGARRLEVT